MVDKNINTDVELTIELMYRDDDDLPDTNNKHDVMIIEQKKVAELNEKVSMKFLCLNFMRLLIKLERLREF